MLSQMSKKSIFPKTLTTVTTFSKILAVLLIFAFILAGVYAGMLYQRWADATAFSSFLSSQMTQQGSSVKHITMQDNGKTLHTHVGDIISFELGSVAQRWTLSFSSPVLKRISLGIAEKLGQEGRYVVVEEGIVVVRATGVAQCPAGTPCPLYAMNFSITIEATK
jgi:hypothetical protein